MRQASTILFVFRFGVLLSAALYMAGCESKPQAPQPVLEDVTRETGIDFVHDRHETGDFRVPEINGAGVGVLDYDNDGWYDLYFVQGGQMSGVPGGRVLSDQLYRNRRNGTFENVTERAGIHATGFGMGVACADYNNDGFVDIFVYNTGANQLWQNNGDGTFTDVTAKLQLGDPRWGDGAAFFDYDADGWLDLYVCNYFAYDPNDEKVCTMRDTSQRDYCGPATYEGDRDILYHNNGDGTFTDVSLVSGIAAMIGTGMGAAVADFTGDGRLDVYVGNDGRPNRLFVQQPDHSFADQASLMLCDVNAEGQEQSSMGITIEDFDLDGRFDVLLGHFWDDPNTIYLNSGEYFRDFSTRTGLSSATRRFTTWAISTLDLYNDGRMQFYFGNGKVNKANKVIVDKNNPYAERDLLLAWSYEDLRFTDITDDFKGVFETSYTTRGSAVIDYDNDGDMDLVLTNNHGPARVLRNNSPRKNHWLMVRVLTPDGKRDAYGSVVEIEVKGHKPRRRTMYVASSYCSSCDPRLHFGLGQTAIVDRLTVQWVDGTKRTWTNVKADQLFVARHDKTR